MNARRMLLDAFYELIQEHDFDDITVQMIIDRAQLSRGTFYRHYEDKYDLMNSFYRDNVESLLARVGKDADIREIIESILVHIEQNIKYYRKAVKTEGMDSFLDFLKEYSIEFYSVHYPQPQGADELAPEVYFEVEMLCGGHVAALKSWIECVKRTVPLTQIREPRPSKRGSRLSSACRPFTRAYFTFTVSVMVFGLAAL